MSFYNVVPQEYFEGRAGSPGGMDAPIPWWGLNPFRAGPVRVGVGEDAIVDAEFEEIYAPPPGTIRVRDAALLAVVAGGFALAVGLSMGKRRRAFP